MKAAGLSVAGRRQDDSERPAQLVNVSPQQLPPPTTLETLKEVAELLSRHSADDYFVLDAVKVQEIFKDHKQVIDFLYDKTNRDTLRVRSRRV